MEKLDLIEKIRLQTILNKEIKEEKNIMELKKRWKIEIDIQEDNIKMLEEIKRKLGLNEF